MEELEDLALRNADAIINRGNVFGFYSKAQVSDLRDICRWLHQRNVSLRKDVQALLGRVKSSDDLFKELAIANTVIRELVPHAVSLTEPEIQDFIANKKASFSFLKRKAVS
jgi:hypothetical protein